MQFLTFVLAAAQTTQVTDTAVSSTDAVVSTKTSTDSETTQAPSPYTGTGKVLNYNAMLYFEL